MGKLADKIRNLAKAAKSRREPVVGDIEIDDEPYIGDIEVEDSEDDDLDGIVVLTEEDLDNEFSAGAEESRKYGNKKMGERRDEIMDVYREKEDDVNKRTASAPMVNKFEQDRRAKDKMANLKEGYMRKRKGRAGNVHKALQRMLSERNAKR